MHPFWLKVKFAQNCNEFVFWGWSSFLPSHFCSSGKSLEGCIIGSLNIFESSLYILDVFFSVDLKEMFISFCKLFSRIFQKNFFLLRLILGCNGWVSEKDEEEVLKERKEKAIFPSLMICFLLILLKCGQTTSFCKVQKNCHHLCFFFTSLIRPQSFERWVERG